MNKFNIGDVVMYAPMPRAAAIVTHVNVRYRDISTGRIRDDGVELDFQTRNPSNIARGRLGGAIYSPEILMLDDRDPSVAASWSDCVWQPKVAVQS